MRFGSAAWLAKYRKRCEHIWEPGRPVPSSVERGWRVNLRCSLCGAAEVRFLDQWDATRSPWSLLEPVPRFVKYVEAP